MENTGVLIALALYTGQTYKARAWLEYVKALVRSPSLQIAVPLDDYNRFWADGLPHQHLLMAEQ